MAGWLDIHDQITEFLKPRMLGKKTMEAEILKEAVEIARSRKWITNEVVPSLRSDQVPVSDCAPNLSLLQWLGLLVGLLVGLLHWQRTADSIAEYTDDVAACAVAG